MCQITQHKWAWPFMQPVDVEGLGLHDYYEVKFLFASICSLIYIHEIFTSHVKVPLFPHLLSFDQLFICSFWPTCDVHARLVHTSTLLK